MSSGSRPCYSMFSKTYIQTSAVFMFVLPGFYQFLEGKPVAYALHDPLLAGHTSAVATKTPGQFFLYMHTRKEFKQGTKKLVAPCVRWPSALTFLVSPSAGGRSPTFACTKSTSSVFVCVSSKGQVAKQLRLSSRLQSTIPTSVLLS